jgi:hypothetical protein
MPNWSKHDLNSFEARNIKQPAKRPDAEKLEGDLHDKILAECDRRLWYPIHSRMDRPTTNGKGVCDFIIAADKGQTFYIECKSATGKLSGDQQIFITWMKRLGHPVHVVTSFQQFLELTR